MKSLPLNANKSGWIGRHLAHLWVKQKINITAIYQNFKMQIKWVKPQEQNPFQMVAPTPLPQHRKATPFYIMALLRNSVTAHHSDLSQHLASTLNHVISQTARSKNFQFLTLPWLSRFPLFRFHSIPRLHPPPASSNRSPSLVGRLNSTTVTTFKLSKILFSLQLYSIRASPALYGTRQNAIETITRYYYFTVQAFGLCGMTKWMARVKYESRSGTVDPCARRKGVPIFSCQTVEWRAETYQSIKMTNISISISISLSCSLSVPLSVSIINHFSLFIQIKLIERFQFETPTDRIIIVLGWCITGAAGADTQINCSVQNVYGPIDNKSINDKNQIAHK